MSNIATRQDIRDAVRSLTIRGAIMIGLFIVIVASMTVAFR